MPSFTTVFVDASAKPRREIARDARDPFENVVAIEKLARAYSVGGKGRTVQVWPEGLYTKKWRQQNHLDALYECHDGKPTEDYR